MNLPNKLTVSRFALTALFLWALFSPLPFNDTLALIFFCVAGFTDFLDGSIARRRGLVTNFGILMDPLADKVLICSAFIAFVESTHLNPGAPVKVAAWMVIIIVARELAITGLRLLAASKNIVLAAEKFGKHKTILANRGHHCAAGHGRRQRVAAVAAKLFSALGGRVCGNRAVGDGRADGGVRLDLPVAQPRDLFERHLKLPIGEASSDQPLMSPAIKFGTRDSPSGNYSMMRRQRQRLA